MKQWIAMMLVGCLLLAAVGCADQDSQSSSRPDSSGPSFQEGENLPSGNESSPSGDSQQSGGEFAALLGEAKWQELIQKLGFIPNVFVKHPDGRWLFYEAEFEEPTSLWIYEPTQPEPFRELLPSDKLPAQTAIKGVCWPDEKSGEVLLILGHRYGTVALGGDIYRLDLTSKVLNPFYKTGDDRVQVTGMTPEGETLLLSFATFDQNMDNPVASEQRIPLYTQSEAVALVTNETPPAGSIGLAAEPLAEPFAFAPAQTMKLDDSGESILIVPRYVGSTVRVYSVKMVGNDFVQTGWLGAYYNTADGWSLDLKTVLPEGLPMVKVVVSCFGKTGEFLVSYNGKGESNVRWIGR